MPTRRFALVLATAAIGLVPLLSSSALAQRPFSSIEPFYRDESARRAFFDGIAVTAEVSYIRPGTITNQAVPVFNFGGGLDTPGIPGGTALPITSGGLGVSFNVDYQLAPQLDLGLVIDAAGGLSGRTTTLSWVSLKQYFHADGTDYALRLAFDPRPATDGSVGFRQMDVAGALTSVVSKSVSTDLVAGVRRVNLTYERVGYRQETPNRSFDTIFDQTPEILQNRSSGNEIHATFRMNFHFDPARSHVFTSLVYEGGSYLISEYQAGAPLVSLSSQEEGAFVAHVIWARMGVQLNRPSYALGPFINVPLLDQMKAPAIYGKSGSKRVHFGLRATLR